MQKKKKKLPSMIINSASRVSFDLPRVGKRKVDSTSRLDFLWFAAHSKKWTSQSSFDLSNLFFFLFERMINRHASSIFFKFTTAWGRRQNAEPYSMEYPMDYPNDYLRCCLHIDQQYSFEIVFLGYSIWVVHRVLHGVGLRVLSSPTAWQFLTV